MTYTYTQDTMAPRLEREPVTTEQDAVFTPSYARRPVKQKKLKTWMVLAPIGALALIGGAATMLLTGGDETQPLAEPAPTAVASTPLVPATVSPPLSSTPVASMPAPAVVTPAPVVRQAAPVRRAAPVTRSEPARNASPAPRMQAPADPTGRQAYSPSVAASTSSPAVPTSTPVTPPAPAITVQPLN